MTEAAENLCSYVVLTIWMWREYGIAIQRVPDFIIVRDVREKVQQ